MSQYTLRLIGDTQPERATLTTTMLDVRCHIELTYRDRRIEAEAGDFFEALCCMREQLEPENLVPLCYGASLNVYPSAMA